MLTRLRHAKESRQQQIQEAQPRAHQRCCKNCSLVRAKCAKGSITWSNVSRTGARFKLRHLPAALPQSVRSIYIDHSPDFREIARPIRFALRKLEVVNCNLSDLSSLDSLPPTLVSVNFSGNRLESVPDIFRNCTELDLSENQIRSLPPLPLVLELSVSFNQLRTLPHGMTRLRELWAGSNCLTSIPSDMLALTHLSLPFNEVKVLHCYPNLGMLRIHDNKIEELPHYPNLVCLYAESNRLRRLDYYPELNFASLAGNRLTEISPRYWQQRIALTINLSTSYLTLQMPENSYLFVAHLDTMDSTGPLEFSSGPATLRLQDDNMIKRIRTPWKHYARRIQTRFLRRYYSKPDYWGALPLPLPLIRIIAAYASGYMPKRSGKRKREA